MDYAAIRRIAEGIANSRDVGATPLADSETLRNLFVNKMSKDRELAREVVVDANDLFPEVRRGIVTADERSISVAVGTVALRKNTCGQQGSSISRYHALRDGVVREGRPLNDASRSSATRTIRKKNRRIHFSRGRHVYDSGAKVGVTRRSVWVETPTGNMLVGETAINILAPLHVVEEEGLLPVWIVKFTKSDGAADVEAEYIYP